jgi:hypothetical protein
LTNTSIPLSRFEELNQIAVIAMITNVTTKNIGDVGLLVFLKSIKDNNGVNPAERLAAVEYNMDKTVQRKLTGNISASITGTVA